MRRLKLFLAGLMMIAMALPVLSQTPAPQGNIAQIYSNRPKPGMTAQYEAGRKKHMAWHKAQKDTWGWMIWEVISGDATGAYIIGTFNHQWKDFDREKFGAADTADAALNLVPYEASSTMAFWARRTDLSITQEELTAPYVTVTHYFVNPEGVTAFVDSTKKINDAIKKTNYPVKPSQFYSLVNGGEGPHYVLVTARQNFADMQAPEKSMQDMMKEAYGDEGAKILADRAKTYHRSATEMLQYRPDLGYTPPK
jgi:hypothetical protein